MNVDSMDSVRPPARSHAAGGAAGERRLARTVAVLAVGAVLGVSGSGAGASAAPTAAAEKPVHAAAPPVSAADMASLQHRLDVASAKAQRAASAVLAAASKSVSLRSTLDSVAAEQSKAQADLQATAAQMYEQAPPQGLPDIESLVIDPGEMTGLVSVGTAAVGQSQSALARADAQGARLTALTVRADKARHALVLQAAAVYADQDQARQLIAQLQAALRAQAKAAAARADKAAKAAAAAKLARLAAAKAKLDAQSNQLTLAMSPTMTAAGKAALAQQSSLLQVLLAAGGNYPAGYHPTGQTLTGISSWYGDDFAGRPTSSGIPFNPELLTAAMKVVPLGTVVRVTNLANNIAVNVIVNDHGPYVGNRILDLSHAAAIAIGNSGLATVRIEILAPGS